MCSHRESRGQYVVIDIDGTISRVGDRLKYLQQEPPDWDSFYAASFEDEPVPKIIELVKALYSAGYDILFFTGRRQSCRDDTVKWILTHFGSWFACGNWKLFMRADADHRHDIEVKPEFMDGYPRDEIFIILEDRTSMVKKWRELGFTCLQVADGDF